MVKRVVRRISIYRELSKSGIVALVLISVMGGYFVGQTFEHRFSIERFLLTLFGILFLAAGSSALNQLQERLIDAEMPRTQKRPIPSGRLSLIEAWIFILFCLGFGLTLLWRLSFPVFLLGILAVLSYNGLYTLWWKKKWAFAAVPGALPGALPILMGYVSASNRVFAPAGVFLFGMLFFWQMPHFWALALRYRTDYERGGIPTLPVVEGLGVTVNHIILWCLAYVGLALVGPLFIHVGATYCIVTFFMSLKILVELKRFVRAPETQQWLRFFLWINFSLIIYLAAAVFDLWSIYLIPLITQ